MRGNPIDREASTHGRLSGAFTDRRSALRCARDEADGHPGYIGVLREA